MFLKKKQISWLLRNGVCAAVTSVSVTANSGTSQDLAFVPIGWDYIDSARQVLQYVAVSNDCNDLAIVCWATLVGHLNKAEEEVWVLLHKRIEQEIESVSSRAKWNDDNLVLPVLYLTAYAVERGGHHFAAHRPAPGTIARVLSRYEGTNAVTSAALAVMGARLLRENPPTQADECVRLREAIDRMRHQVRSSLLNDPGERLASSSERRLLQSWFIIQSGSKTVVVDEVFEQVAQDWQRLRDAQIRIAALLIISDEVEVDRTGIVAATWERVSPHVTGSLARRRWASATEWLEDACFIGIMHTERARYLSLVRPQSDTNEVLPTKLRDRGRSR